MAGVLRLFVMIFRLLTWPFRVMGRVLFRGGASRAVATARKATGGVVATDADTEDSPASVDDAAPRTATSFPFRAIDRPRLAEQSASELTLDVAEQFVARADRFYANLFDLFPQGGLFYEEVEMEELAHALGADDPSSSDARFVTWMLAFRRTLNDNARRLLMIYAPLLFALLMSGAIWAMARWPALSGLPGLDGPIASPAVFMPAMVFTGLLFLLLIYQWPFKVIIQRNLLGLDNYITSRFSRINQNFQVAKRFALNVERNKRMSQADELRHEAGVWTVSYNWFALRLFLCERVVRNQMYQVNRNATLYGIGGVIVSAIVGVAAYYVWSALYPVKAGDWQTPAMFVGATAVYILLAYAAILNGAAREARRVLLDNEWFRFGDADLDQTIKDHVGEDKLQIVTFRDRNRME